MNIFWMEIRVKLAIFHDFFHGWDSCKFFTRNSSVDNFENYHISDYILNMNYRVNFLLFHDFWYFCYSPWLSMTTNFSMTFPDFPWQWESCQGLNYPQGLKKGNYSPNHTYLEWKGLPSCSLRWGNCTRVHPLRGQDINNCTSNLPHRFLIA